MRIALFLIGLACIVASGCTVVSNNRVFPKLSWYWTAESKQQRKDNKEYKDGVRAYQESLAATNGAAK